MFFLSLSSKGWSHCCFPHSHRESLKHMPHMLTIYPCFPHNSGTSQPSIQKTLQVLDLKATCCVEVVCHPTGGTMLEHYMNMYKYIWHMLSQIETVIGLPMEKAMLGTEALESPRFSLCLFHSVLAVRYQRYQCCFQSTAYDTWSSCDTISVER